MRRTLAFSVISTLGLQTGIFLSPTANGETKVDNSEKNAAVEAANLPTADDQSNKGSDLELLSKIRRDIVSQEHFSTNAKNVKIIVKNGAVDLSGPVKTVKEKSAIEALAQKHAGGEPSKVTSHLEVQKK